MLGRIARDVGHLVAAVVGWVLVFLAIAAIYVGISSAVSGHPPYCTPPVPGWLPPAGALDLQYLILIDVPAATLLAGRWWALGATTMGARAVRTVVVVGVALLVVAAAGYFPTPVTCGLAV
jgi:hypothetical protein